jgi:hypothetical protein
VFHFNKGHNADPQNIPPWIVKYKGESHYIWHLKSDVGFDTKETPDNPATKGSLMFRGYLDLQEQDGKLTATITGSSK